MPRTSYGETKLNQAWQIVAALIKRQGVNGVQLRQDDEGIFYLSVEASLSNIATWSNSTTEKVRETLTQHLGKDFLDILIDDLRYACNCSRVCADALNTNFELVSKLQQLELSLTLPNFSPESRISYEQWWQANSNQWLEQFRQVVIEHRNIGQDWKFTTSQKQKLERYCEANKLLAEVINIEGAVSDSVRIEIEDTLLLPWQELQRCHPEIYGQEQSA